MVLLALMYIAIGIMYTFFAFAGTKPKSPQVSLKYILECKPILEFYLNSNDKGDGSSTNSDHPISLPEDEDLPKNLLNLLTYKSRQYLKELVAIYMKKR